MLILRAHCICYPFQWRRIIFNSQHLLSGRWASKKQDILPLNCLVQFTVCAHSLSAANMLILAIHALLGIFIRHHNRQKRPSCITTQKPLKERPPPLGKLNSFAERDESWKTPSADSLGWLSFKSLPAHRGAINIHRLVAFASDTECAYMLKCVFRGRN